MAKRDTLYTVNKWNKPFFDKEKRKRLYFGGGPFDINSGYTNGVKTNQGSLVNSFGITSWDGRQTDANLKTAEGIIDFTTYSNPGRIMNQLHQYRYAPEATQSIQSIPQETQSLDNESKSNSDWMAKLPETLNRLNAAYNTYNTTQSAIKALNNGSIDFSKLTTKAIPSISTAPAKLPDIVMSSGKTIAGDNLINHLGLNVDALTSEATKDAVKASSQKLANDLISSTPKSGITNLGKTGINIGASVLGEVGKNLISNGLSTTAGTVIDNIGNVAGTVLPFIPGVGWAAAPIVIGASKLLAGVANQFGHKTFDNGATAYTKRLNLLNPNGSNEYISNLLAYTGAGPQATYRDGWFTDKGKHEAAAINNAQDMALSRFKRGIKDAIENNNWNQLQYALNDYSTYGAMGGKLNRCKCNKKSYGGYLDSASPTGFNFLSDLINTQQLKNQANQDVASSMGNSFMNTSDMGKFFASGGPINIKKSHRGRLTELKKRTGKTEAELYNDGNPDHKKMVTFARNARKWHKHALGGKLNYGEDKDIRNNSFFNGPTLYALGGIYQAAGSNWGNTTEINEGGTHEENPYEGVQVGVDPEGTPNLVEEGEVIWNDYVFSNRIKCPNEVCKVLRVGVKKDGFTFAEVAKKLLKESKERPNDPISKKGLEANMQKLEDAQEEVKKKMEAEQAVEQFNSLPPEQQVAIMNQEGLRAQDAVALEQMAQEIQSLPPEQQLAIAQQMAMEQALMQGEPLNQPSPEELAIMQQLMTQQQMPQNGINPQEALAQAAAMQQQAINGSAYGGRLFAEGGELNELQDNQATEQTDPEMAKYSDEELQEIIDEYEEAANGEKKVTKGRLARLKKKAEKAERELARRNSQGENPEEEQPNAAQELSQEPTQEQIQAAAQAQAQQLMMEGQPQGMPLEGVPPELAMMMQQQMGGQPLMSPEQMAAVELQQQQGGQYAYGGKLYLTGGELVKALGFKNTKDLPFTLKDLGINDWNDEVNPQNAKSIYGKVTDPIIKHLIKSGWNPFDNILNSPDRWFENSAGEAINWGDAGLFKTNGYNEKVLKEMAKRYPHVKYALEHGLKDHNFSKGNVKREDLFKAISEAPEWKETEQYLYDPTNGLARRLEYIARRRGIDQNGNDTKFLNKWNQFGEFKLGDDGKYTYTLKDGKQADFDAAFKAAREDGLIGTMYDVRVPATTKAYRYLLDENGNPTDDILFDTTDYEQVGNPYSYYTLGDDGTFNPNVNNEITYWRRKANSGSSTDSSNDATDESNYLTVGWKPKTNWMDYALGVLPGLTGLGMMLAQGKPDMSGIEAAADAYASNMGALAPIHLTHGLMRPAIIDPRVTHNTLTASRLGTNRLLRNTGPAPSQAASILANDTNYQNQMGSNDLRDWLANREQEQKAATFNEGVARANATFLNQGDQFNAQMLANAGDKYAQARYNAELEKLNQNNAWRAGILGNIGSAMTGLYNAYREGLNRNERDLLAASGVFGETNGLLDNYYGISKVDPKTGKVVRGPYTDWYWYDNDFHKQPRMAISANGGKLKRKKRKGYTF